MPRTRKTPAGKTSKTKLSPSDATLDQKLEKLPTGVSRQKYLQKLDSLLPPEDLPDRAYGDLKKKGYIALYRLLYSIRGTEDRLTRLYRQGKIVGGVYLSKGTEAISVGAGYALDRSQGDMLFPMHRDLGAHIAFGQTIERIYCQYMGRSGSPTMGRDGNTHFSDMDRGIIGMISHLGSMLPVAVGAAIGLRNQGKNAVTLNFIGDGGASIGDFHEGLNFAAVANAPFVLVIENNQYAYSTPIVAQYGAERIIDRAIGYGIQGEVVDGNNIYEVYETVRNAVNRAREGGGPTMIEAVSMRMRGHSEHDDHFYVPKELLEAWAQRDPLLRAQRFLAKQGFLTQAEIEILEKQVDAEIEQAIVNADASPLPDPISLNNSVFAS
ncbi:MAG: thiamine pyrophosphate-dependent dehydrogenase E1 component subunit alpha [Calditrichaeota bacterium]|nr:thiamine pyrophosphate-dependent dehydrogenase E1 component subunit alpha [Calditrichota bacterium]MBT7787543.1 thiamine pyrophosphate-dependent dehydrogenase E1 component subunit alpha [Calditrichota bacterium]